MAGWERETEVLVVGAGPVGLLTALSLAEEGVKVQVVDEGSRPAERSYALALHPNSLGLLDDLDLAAPLIRRGQKIECCTFYEGSDVKAEVRFDALESFYPFVLVLPQSRLEDVLHQRLQAKGVEVLWAHRLKRLEEGQDGLRFEVQRLGQEEGAGHGEWIVQERMTGGAQFVAGCDGHDSLVRRSLGIPFESRGKPQRFAVFEFATDPVVEPEGPCDPRQSILHWEGKWSVIWPMGEGRFRCGFQLDEPDRYSEPREKTRQALEVVFPTMSRRDLRRLIVERAPWFRHSVGDLLWSAVLRFERRLAGSFARGRAVLAGDAAHLALPVGVQSMNAGLAEARDLGGRLYQILRQDGDLDLLQEYARVHRQDWERILRQPQAPSGPVDHRINWVERHESEIRGCLPASGAHIDQLMRLLSGSSED
ncbi:MAG TPA: NAD(P)/FAD-dependent oxidoreductase [Acidobacteriota bacterium]|nr:NAD(P)/FAD-dependent oxidoreductase [Acidobacteriota bacterium]